MSRRWTAECWLGSKSGYVDIEVNASTFGGAKEQLENVYGATQIRNLREIKKNSSSSGDSVDLGTAGGAVVLLGGLWLFITFMPWFLMGAFGAGSAFLVEKMTGFSIEDYVKEEKSSDEDHKKALAIILTSLILGGYGFVQGSIWQKEFNKDTNNQPKVEEVRQK